MKPRLDPNRPYSPPETHAEYVKRLSLETRNYAWALDLWAAKLGRVDDVRVTTVRAACRNLMEMLEGL